jgi:hypothetical protein
MENDYGGIIARKTAKTQSLFGQDWQDFSGLTGFRMTSC